MRVYQLTKTSLYSAVSAGLEAEDIIRGLGPLSKVYIVCPSVCACLLTPPHTGSYPRVNNRNDSFRHTILRQA